MKIISIKETVRSAVLCMGTMDSCPVVPQANEPHANLFEIALTSIREYLLLHTANRIDIGLGMRLF
jgi:hypothetical protein